MRVKIDKATMKALINCCNSWGIIKCWGDPLLMLATCETLQALGRRCTDKIKHKQATIPVDPMQVILLEKMLLAGALDAEALGITHDLLIVKEHIINPVRRAIQK